MINCEVSEDRMGNLVISFNGKSLYLQTDYDRAAFGVACGAIKAPEGWDGQPESLLYEWWEIEWEEITECPEEYVGQAVYDEKTRACHGCGKEITSQEFFDGQGACVACLEACSGAS